MIKIFKQLGPALFKGGDKTVLTSALSAVKIGGLAFGINFVIQPLLAKFNVKPADRTKIIELYAKLVRFGIDYFIGKFGEDLSFEIFFNLLRVDLYHDLLTDFVSNTQPSLDTAAIQFAHDAIRADTATTLAAVEVYDGHLSDFTTEVHDITTTALTDLSVIRGLDGVFAQVQSLLGFGGPISGKISAAIGGVLKFLKAPADAATDTAFSVATVAPLIGDVLLADPTGAAITAVMTGAEALPPLPSAAQSRAQAPNEPGRWISVVAAVATPTATIRPTSTPTPLPTATPIPLAPPVQAYLSELGRISKILAAGDVASYAAERANLIAANSNLFNYLNPISGRASAALPNLTGSAANDANLLAPQFDTASTDIGLFYMALEVWDVYQDAGSLSLAASFAADVVSAVMAVGQQAALVQSDLKGITVPGQIIITGNGVPAGQTNFGKVIDVEYTFTNVGDRPLPSGTATVFANANLTLITSATVTLPALAAGGTFLASWQFQVAGSGPGDLGHYQVVATVTGAQSPSLDDIFCNRWSPNIDSYAYFDQHPNAGPHSYTDAYCNTHSQARHSRNRKCARSDPGGRRLYHNRSEFHRGL